MHWKRMAGAAAIAASVGISGLSIGAATAQAEPPQCNQPDCHTGWNNRPGHDWNGPPPQGGWNRHWDGPDRGIDQGRFDHQPFQYNGFEADPIWAPDQGGWGFWFFGAWIPL